MYEDNPPPIRPTRPDYAVIADFSCAREAFGQLFFTEKPLEEMGYNRRQIALTKPVLSLIESNGKIRRIMTGETLLDFDSPDGGSIEIRVSKKGNATSGYRLFAAKYNKKHDFFRALTKTEDCPVFKEMSEILANIHLVDPRIIDVKDIGALVRFLYSSSEFTDSTPLPDSFLAELGRKTGVISTYEAIWIDEKETKLAVRLHSPIGEPMDVVWKILSDHPKGLTGVGRMPDATGNTGFLAKRVFEKKEGVFSGNLSLHPNSA